MGYVPFNREEDDAARMKRAIAEAHLPASVKSYRIEFDEDTTGEPSLWLQLIIDDRAVSSSKKKLSELRRFMDAVRTVAPTFGVSRYPYFRLLSR